MITRRNFLRNSLLTGAGLSLSNAQLFAQLLGQEKPYKMTLLRNNVGYFTERGGTIGYFIDEEGIAVVDTQFPEQSQHLIEEIQKQSLRKFDLLINTHHHGDHTSGNIAYKGIVNNVVAHENSKRNQMRVAEENKRADSQLYPETTFSKEWSGKVGKETISLKYFGAAHTDGDALVHFENANIVHTGDLVFNRRYPYIDKSAGANIKSWIQVLENAQKIYDNDTMFIFGHSDNGFDVIGKKSDINAFQNYLSRLLDTVDVAIKSGKSEEEVMKITEIIGAEEWKGDGISRSLSAAYTELSKE
ncbi:MBL fold metallo-hydrolase [Namhaeicola litoreus]|uniref:MBL fold metallo-hydrolase n=1 Tax=Namhaeicola litoreus TaxID=1052145 RepID=A0ABW3XYW7_9FLAO